jgi:hypothetical protein
MAYVINFSNKRILFENKEAAVNYFKSVVDSGCQSENIRVGTTIVIDSCNSTFDEDQGEISIWKREP